MKVVKARSLTDYQLETYSALLRENLDCRCLLTKDIKVNLNGNTIFTLPQGSDIHNKQINFPINMNPTEWNQFSIHHGAAKLKVDQASLYAKHFTSGTIELRDNIIVVTLEDPNLNCVVTKELSAGYTYEVRYPDEMHSSITRVVNLRKKISEFLDFKQTNMLEVINKSLYILNHNNFVENFPTSYFTACDKLVELVPNESFIYDKDCNVQIDTSPIRLVRDEELFNSIAMCLNTIVESFKSGRNYTGRMLPRGKSWRPNQKIRVS